VWYLRGVKDEVLVDRRELEENPATKEGHMDSGILN